MTILKYEYIYIKILEYILYHFYKYTVSTITENQHNICKPISFVSLNFEVINLSLVSSNWFNKISSILTNQVIGFQNYGILKHFTKSLSSPSSTEFSIDVSKLNNENYKLIKLQNSVKVYETLNQFQFQHDMGLTSKYRKILVNVNGFQSDMIKFLKSTDTIYPDNIQFKLMESNLINMGDYEFILTNDFNQFLKSKKRIYKVHIRLPELYQMNNDQLLMVAENINKLNSKRIIISGLKEVKPAANSSNSRKIGSILSFLNNTSTTATTTINTIPTSISSFSPLSSILLNSELKNLNFNTGLGFGPVDFSNINCIDESSKSISNLKVFTLCLQFDLMNEILGSGINNSTSIIKDSDIIKQHWDHMIKLLKFNFKSLKHLTLQNYSPKKPVSINSLCLNIHKSIKTLLINPKSCIQTLELWSIHYLDSNILDALIQNNSITTLILNSTDPTQIIESVLPHNKTIRNLILNSVYNSHCLQFFDKLIKNGTNIDLYSITYFNKKLDATKFNKLIMEESKIAFTKLNIKEYNIYVRNHNYIKNPQIILSNGSIINIRQVKIYNK